MGSISQQPPLGPYVSPGDTLTHLNQDINSTSIQYNSAVSALSSATSAYNSQKAAIDSFLSNHNIHDWTDWANLGDQEEELLQQYRDLLATLDSRKTSLQTASNNFVSRATSYVDALARRQIYADTTDQNTVIEDLLSILNLPIPTQKISGMPNFPSLTQSQENTLQQATINIKTSSEGSAANNLLDAFTNLRHNEYLIASFHSQALINQGTADSTWYHYLDPNDPTSMDQVNSARSAVSSSQNSMNYFIYLRSGLSSALLSAISSYEAAYQSIRSPLSAAITTFKNYANSWQTNLTTLYNATKQALADTKEAFEEADAAAQLQHSQTVTMDTLTEDTLSDELQASKNRTAALQQIQIGISEIPKLPEHTAHLSLSDLMRTISQVQLTTYNLVRSIQKTEHDINSIRLQMALSNLSLYAQEMSKFNSWAQKVYSQDINYNAQVDQTNRVAYNDFSLLYLQWQDVIANHTNLINAAINDVNAEITQQNQNASLLVNLANELQPSIVDAVNQERTSVPQSGNYLNFLGGSPVSPMGQYSSFSAIPQIPLLPQFTGEELPALPIAPPLPNTAQFPPDFITNVDTMNNTIANLLPELNALQPIIAQKLSSAHPPIALPAPLQQFLLKAVIPVRNFQQGLLAFQRPTTLLMGFIRQYLTMVSGEIASKEHANILQKMLESTMTGLQVSQSSQGGSGLSAASANIFASASTVERALLLMCSSDAFAHMISDAMERAASLAGLNTASSLGISAQGAVSEGGPDRTILLNTMVQLILSAADPGTLRENALTILQGNPDLASLSPEELEQVIAGLVSMQQNMLMFGAISTGIQAGMTPGQIISLLFPGMALTGVGTMEQFLGMGFSQTAAAALAAFALDNAPLISVLLRSGMDQKTILGIVALLAASKGITSLTTGVPGGPAFLDTLLSILKQAGITLTTPISNTKDFVKELAAQLEGIVPQQELESLKAILLQTPKPVPMGEATTQAFLDFFQTLQQIFTPSEPQIRPTVTEGPAPKTQPTGGTTVGPAIQPSVTGGIIPSMQPSLVEGLVESEMQPPLVEGPVEPEIQPSLIESIVSDVQPLQTIITPIGLQPLTTTTPQTGPQILINPSDIMQKYIDQFKTLPLEIQQTVLEAAKTFMPQVTELSLEQKGAIGLAVRLGLVSVTDALNLMALYILQSQSKLTSIDDVTTKIAHLLFAPTDKERETIREDLRKFNENRESEQFNVEILNSLSKETVDQVKIAMTNFFKTTTAETLAIDSYMTFAQTVHRLSDFNTVFSNFLINPAKLFSREFSLITGYMKGPKDKSQTSVILSA